MNCKHCKKGSIKENQRFKNLSSTIFCIDCYKEVCEYLHKGVFTDDEYDTYLGKYIELKTSYARLMLALKKKCIDKGLNKNRGYMGLTKKLIEAEEEYCVEELNKIRKTIDIDDFINMARAGRERLGDSGTSINNSSFGFDMENLYIKNLNISPLLLNKQV